MAALDAEHLEKALRALAPSTVIRKYDASVFEGRLAPWTKANWRRVSVVLEPIFGTAAKTRVRVVAVDHGAADFFHAASISHQLAALLDARTIFERCCLKPGPTRSLEWKRVKT